MNLRIKTEPFTTRADAEYNVQAQYIWPRHLTCIVVSASNGNQNNKTEQSPYFVSVNKNGTILL